MTFTGDGSLLSRAGCLGINNTCGGGGGFGGGELEDLGFSTKGK